MTVLRLLGVVWGYNPSTNVEILDYRNLLFIEIDVLSVFKNNVVYTDREHFSFSTALYSMMDLKNSSFFFRMIVHL